MRQMLHLSNYNCYDIKLLLLSKSHKYSIFWRVSISFDKITINFAMVIKLLDRVREIL
jgi:hypothetical protein